MATLADYTLQTQELVHDLSAIDWTQSEMTSRINQARQRVALDTHCCRNLYTGLNVIPGVEQYPIRGGIGGIRIVTGGRGYIAPVVVFSGGGGVGAAAALTVTGGVITGATMTAWGIGYTSTPDVTIVDGAGFVTNWQIRQALAALPQPLNAPSIVFAAIVALPAGDPANIIWNSGAGTTYGDALWLVMLTALSFTQQQMAALYQSAASFQSISSTTFGGPGQVQATSSGQTGLVGPSVTNQQFRLALADQSVNLAAAFYNAVSSSPADPANMIFNSGAVTTFGDDLSDVLVSELGFTPAQAAQFYVRARTKISSSQTITNQQLRLALADPSYGLIAQAIGAISSSPADFVNIQWNSGAGTTAGDALYSLLATLTFPGGKNVATLYAFATTFPVSMPGSGATAQAIALHSILDINLVSLIWGTSRITLEWRPFSTFQAYARATISTPSGRPAMWTEYWENNILFFYRIPDQVYTVEIDAICLPDPLVNTTDIETQILPPCDELVQYWAAHLCLLKLQQFQQADYYEAKYTRRLRQIQGTRFSVRNPNIYYNRDARMRRQT